MKLYNTSPEGNELASMEPVRYFNLAIDHINEIAQWLKTSEEIAQPLLVHMDIFIYLSKKYPEMAKRRAKKINITELKVEFYSWYERVEKKIPVKFRSGTKQIGEELFEQLEML
ncbi:hypothetical protein GCM10027051_29520 [Niabella terrae]